MTRRKFWTQSEVIRIANLLGFDNFTSSWLDYWRDKAKVFAQPALYAEGMIAFYRDKDVNAGLTNIGARLKKKVVVDEFDLERVKVIVLQEVRTKNVSTFLKKTQVIAEGEGLI